MSRVLRAGRVRSGLDPVMIYLFRRGRNTSPGNDESRRPGLLYIRFFRSEDGRVCSSNQRPSESRVPDLVYRIEFQAVFACLDALHSSQRTATTNIASIFVPRETDSGPRLSRPIERISAVD